MQYKSLIRELRPHALWDVVREGIKMMLPFLAGLGIKQWTTDHTTALMWTAAIFAAATIAFFDRLFPKHNVIEGSHEEAKVSSESGAIFRPRPEDKGWRIESAVFGAEGHPSFSVIDRVRALVAQDKPVVVNWECLGLKKNPYDYETKFLTVTLSVTRSESEKVGLPFNQIHKMVERVVPDEPDLTGAMVDASLQPDITLMVGEVVSYRATIMSANNQSGNIQQVYFTIVFSLRNTGNGTTFDVGGLKVKLGGYEKEARLVTLSGRSYISREIWIPKGIEPITHHMALPSEHGVSRYVVFDCEFDTSLVDAIEALGTFQLTIITDSANPANRVITAEKHLMRQSLMDDEPKPRPLQ
jgi:hypothetical protein